MIKFMHIEETKVLSLSPKSPSLPDFQQKVTAPGVRPALKAAHRGDKYEKLIIFSMGWKEEFEKVEHESAKKFLFTTCAMRPERNIGRMT